MVFFSKRKKPEPWRLKEHSPDVPVPKGANPAPPPPPPTRMFYESGRETEQSIRDTEDWKTYMAGYRHASRNRA